VTRPGLTPYDFHLLAEGTHGNLYDKLGAHVMREAGRPPEGTRFAVWAPNAESVEVIGDWTDWQPGKHPLEPVGQTGVWQGFVPGIGPGRQYKYRIRSRFNGYTVAKADPFAFASEHPPATASVIADLQVHTWGDQSWMANRHARNALDAPMSIYEVHLGSWRRDPGNPERQLSYGEIAPMLVEHVRRTGFTHVELMPVAEHPFYASWGYQVTSFFAPSARYGTPADFMTFIETLHQAGIAVILDWTPAHFPTDEHGLIYFDGTHLYEHADPRQGIHAEWGSAVFNYGRNEVRSFLMSNANFWLDRYHVDGLRVDAVASMLHLDYGRKQGEWIPNKYGGREDLDAVDFLRTTNVSIYQQHPDVQTMAEESTSWPMVSRPVYLGGLGFGLKWDMGWMHDTLDYMAVDPVFRRYHHHKLTFRSMYHLSENFVLPLSHDEVVHGKGSLLNKMPGDTWQKFANLRLLYAYMWAQPGKKLVFMGGEFGQWREWSHDRSLDWHLLEESSGAGPLHRQMLEFMAALNRLYKAEPALSRRDFDPAGFEWIAADDVENSIYAFIRRGQAPQDSLVCLFNFTPVPRYDYHLGLPGEADRRTRWVEVLNTDAGMFGGSNLGNLGGLEAQPVSSHGRPVSAYLTLPPLAALFLKPAP
jgi:1,4-alpha-glucan branching enzyme